MKYVFRAAMERFARRGKAPRRPVRAVRLSTVAAVTATMVAAVLIALEAPASAAVPGLQIVSASSATDSNTLKSATAHCPAGKRVIGTAFHLLGAQGDIVLDDLIPAATSVTMQAGEDQDGTPAVWRVTAVAVCANPLPGLEIITTSSEFGPARDRNVQAPCPAGKRVIGSGARLTQGFGHISISNLIVSHNSVFAFATDDQDGFSGSWSVATYAICAFPLPGQEIVSATTPFDSDGQKLVTATCPSGKRALGTGWSLGGGGQVVITYAGIGLSGVTQIAHEDDDGFPGGWSLNAAVICATA